MGWRHPYDAISRALPYRWLGHIYQQRFKSFPIQSDEHFLVVCRYVERNALRAGLVKRAEQWRWGSLWRWMQNSEPFPKLLSPWPIVRLPNWTQRVNKPLSNEELDAVRRCVHRGQPFGDESWIESIARRLNSNRRFVPTDAPRNRQDAFKIPKRDLTPFLCSGLSGLCALFSTRTEAFDPGKGCTSPSV